jgi:hypothetical protein
MAPDIKPPTIKVLQKLENHLKSKQKNRIFKEIQSLLKFINFLNSFISNINSSIKNEIQAFMENFQNLSSTKIQIKNLMAFPKKHLILLKKFYFFQKHKRFLKKFCFFFL